MKQLLSLTLFVLLLSGMGSMATAEDCVEIDIELEVEQILGDYVTVGTGYFELVNCGDESAVVVLSIEVDLGIGQPFQAGGIPVTLGAGEMVTREFRYTLPSIPGGGTAEFCVTATSGDAVSTDCITVDFVSGGGSPEEDNPKVGIELTSLSASDCVDFDFEISDEVTTTPGDFFIEAYFELTNCNDTAAQTQISVTFDYFNITVPLGSVYLGAGETISREFRFPVPPVVPEGEYTVCVTATQGDAQTTSCETIMVYDGIFGGGSSSTNDPGSVLGVGNYPNPFNPSTEIAFTLPQSSSVSLVVYNVTGQMVTTLISGESLAAGDHRIRWDGRNENGQSVSSGIYLYRLVAGDQVTSKKMILTK